MKTPKIAIIDSGISLNQINDVYKLDIIGEYQDPIDNLKHGCVIYQIIRNYTPNALIRCIKITDDFEIREDYLCEALRLILNDCDVDIVNISMGIIVSERLNEISDLCLQLRNKGVIVISAFDNDGAMSYPAALPFVVGVDMSYRCKLVNQYEFVQDDIVNIRGFSGVMHIKIMNKTFSVSGTSFACAIMTSKVANLLQAEKVDYTNILSKLEEDAYRIIPKQEYKEISPVPSINKAVVFPFNKEMNALLSNQDLLDFEIMEVYDPVQLGNVGRKVSNLLLGSLNKDFVVKDILKSNWDSDFDTVVLGHTREISEVLKFDFKDYIVQKCIRHKKVLYSFDNIMSQANLKYYVPQVLDINIPRNRFGKLYQVSCPVLGVFGTSSKQGKFTLQLKLRRHFLKENYRLSQIGTEPSSLLFGMNAVYPMGYEGIIPKDPKDSILTLNDLMNKSVTSNTDIVLVGAQSGSNVYSCHNIALFPIETFNLLLATQPDAILLCVNIYDSDEYIYRTILTLENMINTYVIALIISPIAHIHIDSGLSRKTFYEERNRMYKFKHHLEEQFQKEVFILDFEDDAREIFDYCINIFERGAVDSH